MKETFKDISGFEGLYQISNLGNIKSLPRDTGNQYKGITQILSTFKTRHGYLIVSLCKNGISYRFSIQRLVAKAFILNKNKKPCVHHINHNKTDNNDNNLMWVTYSENMKFNYLTGGRIGKSYMKGKFGKDNPCSIMVKQLDLDGNLIKIHDGISEAARIICGSASHIVKVCRGKLNKHKKYRWQYA